MTYRMPTYISAPADRYEVADNMAHFLMANGLGVFGKWTGRMSYADQRKIFGFAMGKGEITIDGSNDTAVHRVSTCFGTLREITVWINECGTPIMWNDHSSKLSAEIADAAKRIFGVRRDV